MSESGYLFTERSRSTGFKDIQDVGFSLIDDDFWGLIICQNQDICLLSEVEV